MSKKKSLLEEVDKTWSITKLIKEAGTAQPQQGNQQQAQPAQGQRAPQQNQQPDQAAQTQQNPQQVQKNIEVSMDQAMAALTKELPNILKSFTASAGDKDSQLDLPGQQQTTQGQQQAPKAQQQQGQQTQQQVQESESYKELKFDEAKFKSHLEELNEGGILGLVASAPAIMQLGGKMIGWMGKKTNAQFMQKWGKGIAHAGHNLHHKYIGVLEKAVAPFMKNATPEARKQAAEAMFMTLVAGLFAGGLAAPDALTAVKGQELASYVKDMIPKAMGSLGFA